MKYLLFVLTVIILASCNEKTVSDKVSSVKVITENVNGQKIEYQFDTLKKVKQGYHKSFHANGKVFIEENYVNDTLSGPKKIYFDNGIIEEEYEFVKGNREGVFKTYHQNGKLQQEGKYSNNQLKGELKTYYKDGILKEIVMMEENVEKGPFTEYHENGKLKTKGEYLGGVETEICKLEKYNVEGKLDTTMICNGRKGCVTVSTAEKGDLKITNPIGLAIIQEMKDKCKVN
jgi:antitoxin component YwqK of YwqJK toxin-antitoxin module